MINRIIDFSVNNKVIVFIIVAAACVMGWWSMQHLPLDAVPDLTDTQVIIYSRWDRSPDIMEDQVTYPIVTAMLGAPKVKAVRGFSDFGYSYVYVIFEDGTDIYWARSRTLEYLSGVLPLSARGRQDRTGPRRHRPGLGLSVCPGGRNRQAQPGGAALLPGLVSAVLPEGRPRGRRGGPGGRLRPAVPGECGPEPAPGLQPVHQPGRQGGASGNKEVGGRLIEFGGTEYMVRGRGYARSLQDFENIVLTASEDGTPIRIKDIGQVVKGPDYRRGVTDLDGTGEVVSGIIVMRQGQNALDVIDRVKAKLKEIEPGLPAGVKIVPIYDRSDLIQRAIGNMKSTLVEVLITVSLVILIFLWHFPSAIIPVITIPVAVLISFIPFRMMGVTANIMSLGGIIIAVGALVDAAIVVVEQVHKKLEKWHQTGRLEDYQEVVVKAVKEVAGPSFFALLVIAVAFLPVLSLESVEGRMFKPLAYTKNLSMLVAAVLAITLDPALRLLFTHMQNFNFRPPWLCRVTNAMLVGTIHPEEKHPISRRLIRVYEPLVTWSLRRKWWVIGGAVVLMLLTIPAYMQLGSEFMPPLEEGSILYMPSTMPGISIGEAQKVLQVTDRIIKSFPEVDRVLGKAGRAETSTDPAPVSMLETLITLKPKAQWRPGMTQEKLIEQMNEALTLPGLANGWTMPIKGRIEMLSTGLRTPLGIKISGADVNTIEEIGSQIESLLPKVKGTRNVFAERTGTGYFLDFDWHREELARYGLSIDDVQDVVANAIGGENVTTTVEGRERYTVNVRYQRDFRSDFSALERILVPAADGKRQIPLGRLASIKTASGPAMIRNEDGLLTGYVYIDIAGRDPNGYVEEAARVLKDKVKLPPGYAISWSGQYEAAQRVKQRLLLVVPLTLFLIFLLLYMNTRSIPKTMLIILAVPFSAVGAIWFLFLLGYNLSIAVWVGLIALLGVDAETGIFMLLYLDLAYAQAKTEGRLNTLPQLHDAIVDGAAKRIRPKFMTAATLLLGLIPIMWATGAGADVMKRIAAPMIGGIFTSFLMELMVYPAIYETWKWHFEVKKEL